MCICRSYSSHVLPRIYSGSDKCDRESECLSFEQHMHVVRVEWQKSSGQPYNVTRPYVLFTTESRSVISDQQRYLVQHSEENVRFATNMHDVLPDSGRGVTAQRQLDADTAMLAALTSLKLQIAPRIVIGNCCSNFHVLVHFFRNGGLGTSKQSTFRCLQEVEDPNYRPCCWKSKRCLGQKQKDIEMWNQRQSLASTI
jgi:hypothetical protein